MLSQTAEHALRAILVLAQRPAAETVPADEIADAIGAPRNYLSKTLNVLAKQGILGSVRGPAGGFRLEIPPRELMLERVIRAFDEPRTYRVCLLGNRPCHDDTPCAAHFRWKAVSQDMWAPLRHTSVWDLLEGSMTEMFPAGGMAGTPCLTAKPAV